MPQEQSDDVTVAPAARTARVAGGATWERLVAATSPHGLVPVPADDPARSALADTLAGTAGPLARTFGLAADHLLSIDLETDDGLRTVTPEGDGEDFRALLGSAHGRGRPVAMVLGLLPLTTLRAGTWWFASSGAEAAGEVLHAWRAWLDGLPESMSTTALVVAPGGRHRVGLRFAHVGDPAEGAALFAELREVLPRPERATVTSLRPSEALVLLREGRPASPVERTTLLEALPMARLEDVPRAVGSAPVGAAVELRLRGGVIARPTVAGCVPGRHQPFALTALGAELRDVSLLLDALGRPHA